MAKKLPLTHPELLWLHQAPVFHPEDSPGDDVLPPRISDQFPERFAAYLGFGALKYGDPSRGELDEQEKAGGVRFGCFSRSQLNELIPALMALGKVDGVFAYFDAGPRDPGVAVANPGSAFYRTSLEALPALCFREGEHCSSPTYWWPEGRAWMIYSDPDSSFAVLAASEEVVAKVKAGVDFLYEPFDFETRYELGMFDNPKPTR